MRSRSSVVYNLLGSLFVVGLAAISACSASKKPADAGSTNPDSGSHVMPVLDSGASGAHDAGHTVAPVVDSGKAEDAGHTVDAGQPDAGPPPVTHPRRFVLADENLNKVLLVDLDDATKGWDTPTPAGARDLQLIGGGRLLVSTLGGDGGYYELDLATGAIMKTVVGKGFGGVQSAHRLKNGHTWLTGDGLMGKSGTVVLDLDASDKVVNSWVFAGNGDMRLMRVIANGHFLFGTSKGGVNGDRMVEFDPSLPSNDPNGREVWGVQTGNSPAYMALRLPNGDTAVANGHGASLLIFGADKMLKKTIGGPNSAEAAMVHPNHDSMFQLLRNGHYVMSNWEGHGTGHGDLSTGWQVLEYDADGKLVWHWDTQDPNRVSGIHGVLVLDGLDLQKLHDDSGGVMAPVQ